MNSKLNTGLLGLVTIMLALIGFFARDMLEQQRKQLSDIQQTQQMMWQQLVPRHEFQASLEAIRVEDTRLESEIVELRARVVAVEASSARYNH